MELAGKRQNSKCLNVFTIPYMLLHLKLAWGTIRENIEVVLKTNVVFSEGATLSMNPSLVIETV